MQLSETFTSGKPEQGKILLPSPSLTTLVSCGLMAEAHQTATWMQPAK